MQIKPDETKAEQKGLSLPFQGGMMSGLPAKLRNRLPGGYLFSALFPNLRNFRFGMHITAIRFRHHFAIYFKGGRRAKHNLPIGELTPPYPVLYHFTSESNLKSILEQGLIPNKQGYVFLTDLFSKRWGKAKRIESPICFRIDTEQLCASGHKISIMNCFDEFTTDYVPKECLQLWDTP